MHDYNPGILLNGLFWTMALPADSFYVSNDGNEASLHLDALPMPNTFQYSNNVSVSGVIGCDVHWNAVGNRVRRGFGRTVPADHPGAFQGRFSEATCTGTAHAAHTGFSFESDVMDATGFWAQMGLQRNGEFIRGS